jgi:hypothetical protein
MKVKDLIRKLKKEDPEVEVLVRTRTCVGNVAYVRRVEKSTYGFFGKNIPCILLNHDGQE